MAPIDAAFPCSLVIHIPFPTHRLAKTAIGTLAVDEELSSLVNRSFSLVSADPIDLAKTQRDVSEISLNGNTVLSEPAQTLNVVPPAHKASSESHALDTTSNDDESKIVLRVDYKATTNRMLRVAVNGFFESLGVVTQVMEELDVDVLQSQTLEDLGGVQGVEQGMTGTTITGA
ncbi:hypothetical protein LTR78_007718 [Recurvomyces mirabilis]|uniref:Uncharacterized protein n=1 Tax=Recurvomyces mirabilis TaxID=574656 RepID=A0AAE0TU05_9PEZI|nr:hypothetical protein LTR78_007718 [Recurvomyces mirabilis]KAK5151605.1 hypothetical protein LTS14_009092 [Recurvomyces mirabilis]